MEGLGARVPKLEGSRLGGEGIADDEPARLVRGFRSIQPEATYAARQLRPYVYAAASQFSPKRRTLTQRLLEKWQGSKHT